MSLLKPCTEKIEVILFDMNGTLRVREPHEPTQRAAINRILEFLGMEDVPDVYWDELSRRQKAYSSWAQENMLQLSEKEIWTQWILPDVPPEGIEPVAAELTLAWSERKGRTIPRQDAEETIIELKRRGYRLGVISNTMSTLDIPRSLEKFGWKDIFEVVILSSVLKYRKPAPEIFWEATRLMKVEPAQCAYLGNRISRDLVGCKKAGFALGIIIEQPGIPRVVEQDQDMRSDVVIKSLKELLNIFPARVLPRAEV
jgi:putative hydrolase of the HAD superfamily